MNKKIFGLIVFFLLIFGYYITSDAAINVTSKQVNSGEQFSVSVTSDTPTISYTVSLTGYNGLTFVTSSGGTGAGGTAISDAKTTGMTSLATFTFKAPEVTENTTYKISVSATGMGREDATALPDSSATATITVKAPEKEPDPSTNPDTPNTSTNPTTNTTNPVTTTNKETTPQKSTVTTLSNLGITPNDFTGFTPSKKEYTVTVPNNVETIEVYAKKGQNGQTISGTGTKTLQEGENRFEVVVTAEDGKATTTYAVIVNREAAQTEEPREDLEEPEEFGLKTLNIEGITLNPEFSTNVYEYTAKLTENKENLEVNTVATESNATIEITGNENLKEGENVITILVTNEAGDKTAAYQITVEKNVVDQEALAKQQDIERLEKQRKTILIGGIAVLILLIVIAVIIIRNRKRRAYEDYSVPYSNLNDDDNDSYNDYNSDYQEYEKISDKFKQDPYKDSAEDSKDGYKNNFDINYEDDNMEKFNNQEENYEENNYETEKKRHKKGKRYR